jgi:hypothetical protein
LASKARAQRLLDAKVESLERPSTGLTAETIATIGDVLMTKKNSLVRLTGAGGRIQGGIPGLQRHKHDKRFAAKLQSHSLRVGKSKSLV